MKRIFLLSLFCYFSLAGFAKEWEKVCGEERYIVPENISLQEAKVEALKRAKANALAEWYHKLPLQ